MPLTPLAETWECSVHPDGLSRIGNGKFQGKTLADVLKEHPEYMGSKMEAESELPILVKFIDAKQDLSVQVHPGMTMQENTNIKMERQKCGTLWMQKMMPA